MNIYDKLQLGTVLWSGDKMLSSRVAYRQGGTALHRLGNWWDARPASQNTMHGASSECTKICKSCINYSQVSLSCRVYMFLVIHSVYYNYFHDLFSNVINSLTLSSKKAIVDNFKKCTATDECTEFHRNWHSTAVPGQGAVSYLPSPSMIKRSLKKDQNLEIKLAKVWYIWKAIKGEKKNDKK